MKKIAIVLLVLVCMAFAIVPSAYAEEASIDWNAVDWTQWDWSQLDGDAWTDWVNWMEQEASPEKLVEIAKAAPDGACSVSYANALGNRFVADPTALLAAMALADEQVLDTVARSIAGSEAYMSNGLDFVQFLSELKLPDDATDSQKYALDQIVLYAELVYDVQIPDTGDLVGFPMMLMLLSGVGLAALAIRRKKA